MEDWSISELYGEELSLSRPSLLTSAETATGTRCEEGWAEGPTAGLNTIERGQIFVLAGNRTSIPQFCSP